MVCHYAVFISVVIMALYQVVFEDQTFAFTSVHMLFVTGYIMWNTFMQKQFSGS